MKWVPFVTASEQIHFRLGESYDVAAEGQFSCAKEVVEPDWALRQNLPLSPRRKSHGLLMAS